MKTSIPVQMNPACGHRRTPLALRELSPWNEQAHHPASIQPEATQAQPMPLASLETPQTRGVGGRGAPSPEQATWAGKISLPLRQLVPTASTLAPPPGTCERGRQECGPQGLWCQMGWVRHVHLPSSLVDGQPLPASSHSRERKLLIRALIPSWGPHPHDLIHPETPPQAPPPHSVTREVRASICEF